MAESTTNPKKRKLLTRMVKGVGHLLGPETKSGKVFLEAEKKLTKVMDRLGQSEAYLDTVGAVLSQNLRTRALYVAYQENMLRLLRMPTSGEVDDLRAEVRQVRDQVEALSWQLEVVLDALKAKQDTQPQSAEAKREEDSK